MLSRIATTHRPSLSCMQRTSMMANHLSTSAVSAKGQTLADLPKSWNLTSKLRPDKLYPTPAASHKTPRDAIQPRQVKSAFFTYVRPEESEDPELLGVSSAALKDLGIAPKETETEDFKALVAGNKLYGWDEEKMEGGYPWAQCYGGWQFGSWAGQLGDGRAISLFETTNPESKVRYELQLKGAGITPYSRFADGKAVLRSSIREFICSEALNALKIPTTRALSLTLLPNEKVRRESMEPGAIVARFAQSWLRLGTFDLLRARGEREMIRELCNYIAEDVFDGWESLPARVIDLEEKTSKVTRSVPKDTLEGPKEEEENRFARLYREIVRRNAKTVAAWQAYAFTNGVLNTDNTSVFGLSIDFGPFAFLDNFDPHYTPNHDDHHLRYSYRNQPTIIWWNLVRTGEALGELMGHGSRVDETEFIEKGIHQKDADELVKRAETIITRAGEEFKTVFLDEYKRLMNLRLGLKTQKDSDFQELFSEMLDSMEALELDFNQFFRKLSNLSLGDLESEEGRKEAAGVFFHHEGITGGATGSQGRERLAKWLDTWRLRIIEDRGTSPDAEESRKSDMKSVNPKFIAKNWVLDELIRRVEKDGERDVLDRVMNMALHPYEDSWGGWGSDKEDEERWCGDVPRDSRAMQCSCSS